MQRLNFTITENRQIARDVFHVKLLCAEAFAAKPGQFVNLQIDGHYLRRPISVCDFDGDTLTLIYKVIGQGTAKLAAYQPGQSINILTGLGNGYTIIPAEKPLLIGGGVGVPPLYYLAKELVKAGQKPVALLGFQSREDSFYGDEFAAICETKVITEGYVTSAMPETYDAIYACGPEPMLKAIYDKAKTLAPGHMQLSFEARMACGFGACMACSCTTTTGYKRICKDGPVLAREDIVWK
jgi:dihydroorotate dehydrogenase electron transfer subunit